MARGISTTHPVTAALLTELGLQEDDVTQSFGSAAASAGYHLPEGLINGKQFSSCVDIRWCDAYVNPDFRSRMVSAGFCPFYRDWLGNQHIHAVQVGLTDDAGHVTIHPGPRSQIIDYTRGLDGLVGHSRLTGPLAPTPSEALDIAAAYRAWQPDHRTIVYKPDGTPLPCYAFLQGPTVTCEVRRFVEGLGGTLLTCAPPANVMARRADGKAMSVSTVVALEGDFCRASVRALAQMMGYSVASYDLHDGGTWAEVRLATGGA